MHTSTVLLLALGAVSQARFGQEQVPIAAISALSNRGQSGEAATLGGAAISTLLGAADPCDKLTAADELVTKLGSTDDVIAAAKGLVAAEQNTQVGALPKACADASLPATEELRGIVPLVDPAVDGADVENANSASSLDSPLTNTGMSVADIMAANGFDNIAGAAAKRAVRQTRSAPLGRRALDLGSCSDATIAFGIQDRQEESFQATDQTDFNHGSALAIDVIASFICGQLGSKCKASADTVATCESAQQAAKGLTGQAAADAFNGIISGGGAASQASSGAADQASNQGASQTASQAASAQTTAAASSNQNQDQGGATNTGNATTDNAGNDASNNNNNNDNAANDDATADANGDTATDNGAATDANDGGAAAGGALDFGTCTPTMDFVAGRPGRKADESTFLPTDPVVAQGQQDALNPVIIANRICDQLTNVCGANDAAKAACLTAKAGVDATQKNQATADTFNAALGF
ncbi:hypothetical protein PVAG01_03250 [Phlyctema vagabunda]|uniref:Uncharacterized protein n=1 Tax=Phlyctema vagabunda TaxID=108571 RepID=A0ABR4PT65_9HELO